MDGPGNIGEISVRLNPVLNSTKSQRNASDSLVVERHDLLFEEASDVLSEQVVF